MKNVLLSIALILYSLTAQAQIVTIDPTNIVLAVAELENGKPGQYNRNDDGSHDVDAMQFNTNYLHDLSVYGITDKDVAQAGCYPYELAT